MGQRAAAATNGAWPATRRSRLKTRRYVFVFLYERREVVSLVSWGLAGAARAGRVGGPEAQPTERMARSQRTIYFARRAVPSRSSSVPRLTITSPAASAPCTSTNSPLAAPRFTFT